MKDDVTTKEAFLLFLEWPAIRKKILGCEFSQDRAWGSDRDIFSFWFKLGGHRGKATRGKLAKVYFYRLNGIWEIKILDPLGHNILEQKEGLLLHELKPAFAEVSGWSVTLPRLWGLDA